MFFRRRQKRGGAPPHVQAGTFESSSSVEFYHIDFDMMLKGAIIKRRGGPVRQLGVTVGGSTRLVTSGDTVDRETYEALLAAGAIAPPPDWPGKGDQSPPPPKIVGGDDVEE